jgi:hypothetical protein
MENAECAPPMLIGLWRAMHVEWTIKKSSPENPGELFLWIKTFLQIDIIPAQ